MASLPLQLPPRFMFQNLSKWSCGHNLVPSSLGRIRDAGGRIGNLGNISRSISSGEVFTALKPFFFAVHPDLFGQFPKEREVNENSLKQLNAYIESATHVNNEGNLRPVNLTFYIRQSEKPRGQAASNFEAVNIDLGQRDVRRTVLCILEKCNLPTSFVESIPITQSEAESHHFRSHSSKAPNPQTFWKSYEEEDQYEKVEQELADRKLTQDNLMNWLRLNVDDARTRFYDCTPIRDEVSRLKEGISRSLKLNKILCECGWSVTHFRGCLLSFQILASQHPKVMSVLSGRTLIFGHETGVTMEGHVVLNSGEVRTNWLDAIKNVSKHDAVILRIPAIQKALSRSLRDIKVVHRKFQPNKMAENYEAELRKLTTSLGDYRGKANFPKDWPAQLSHLELVVETDAGPLMVSPTGQMIVPSSCPPFLLVNFISENMEEAINKLSQYKREKYEEIDLHAQCIQTLGLVALDKADNVTPSLMIDCCSRLLSHSHQLTPILQGTHLWITTYYSVLSGGELYIPWNWKGDF